MFSRLIGLSLIVFGLGNAACQHNNQGLDTPSIDGSVLLVNSSLLKTESVGWEARSDYVAMNIPFQPVMAIKQELEQRLGISLQGRTEAHVTVLTPQEVTILRSKLSLEQINRLAEKAKLQSIPLQLICLGQGQLIKSGKAMTTYFIPVRSEGLLAVRGQYAEVFKAAGGQAGSFAPQTFYPHITVGYTDRDLYVQDGVVKDQGSCLFPLQIAENLGSGHQLSSMLSPSLKL